MIKWRDFQPYTEECFPIVGFLFCRIKVVDPGQFKKEPNLSKYAKADLRYYTSKISKIFIPLFLGCRLLCL